MCLLIAASRIIPGTPLLVAANRDEFLDRPASPFTVLADGDVRILGGRDEQSGGTWLAVNEYGVFAGLTNQPLGEHRDPTRRTRGELPLALAAHSTALTAVEHFLTRYSPSDYNGCWLLVGDRQSLFFIDFTRGETPTAVTLDPGLYVLENRALHTSSPKADHVRRIVPTFTGDWATDRLALITVLSNHEEPEPTVEVPKTLSNCVHLDNYGTRSSCVIGWGDDPSLPPDCWVADGSPCVTPLTAANALWTSD
ncbi:MAG TPA: NRDE family protein [Acidimicrobiales bacterium]